MLKKFFPKTDTMSETKTAEDTDGNRAEKTSRTVVTKTVEKTGGCRTTTTTLRSVTEDGLDSALSRLDFDPEKFRCGGTSVTKTVVYTDSSGKREVIEEVIENYGDPDQLASYRQKADKEVTTSLVSTADAAQMGNCTGDLCDTEATPPKVDPGSVSTGQFEEECLQAHNEYRKRHGVPALTLSKEMCAYSKEWADHLAQTDSFKHRTKDKKYGENIFMKWSSNPNFKISGNVPVDSWYSEIKDHVFDREPKNLKSGHFSQVIWKDSRYLGVAWARSKSGKILVVANYDPAGNFIGKFVQNVPPPKK